MMSRRHLLSASLASPFVPVAARAEPAPPPNVILLMTDDLSARELGCYGNPEHETPVLDELARTGTAFRTCWTTPICRPSRALIMTGRYGFRTGFYHNAMRPRGADPAKNFGRAHRTFAQVLGAAGYATAICGKWQLFGRPKQYGFDEFCLWQGYPGYDGPVETTSDGVHPGRPARYWHPAIVRNAEPLATTAADYGPDIFLEFILDFASRRRPGPLFVYHSMCLPHVSWDFGREMETYLPVPDGPGGGTRPGSLRSNIEYIDQLVGRLTSGLEALGLRDRTVILITSDNGTNGYGKNDTVRERGPHVPMIVNCPGIVTAQGLVDDLVDHSDVLPTLADLASVPMPGGYVHDGTSFAPRLRGEGEGGREWIFSYLGDRRFLRDRAWLLDGNRRLWFCDDRRDGKGYEDVTRSGTPEVTGARDRFDQLLQQLPPPPEGVVAQAWKRQPCAMPKPITI